MFCGANSPGSATSWCMITLRSVRERILPIVSRDIPSLKENLATILAALRPADH